MNTLLIRLSAPMQSWGVQSRFSVRDTGLEPSKSGVMGLLCAALGIPREDDNQLQRISAMHMGVRVDREGTMLVDFHSAGKGGYTRADGSTDENNELAISNRYYLANAVFLVGLESEDLALLERLQGALHKPVWSLFLGRKAFVPGEPIPLEDGLRKGETLEYALQAYPCLRASEKDKLRVVLEDQNGSIVRADQPISFSRAGRKFAPRRVTVTFYDAPEPLKEAA